MKVSIVVTCFNEEKNIAACLESIQCQKNAGDIEIIVSDGNSQDGTQEIVKGFIALDSRIKMVFRSELGTAAGRNSGIKASAYEHIAFIDADCVAPDNWLLVLKNGFIKAKTKNVDVIGVGGANYTLKNAGRFVRAVGVALDSYLGSFSSAQGRQYKEEKYVKSLATLNALYEKKRIIEIGCFDETLFSEGEDAELNYRITAKGYKLVFLPESFVYHKMRSSPLGWLKNMFRYGKARARLLKRHPAMWQFSFALPLLFIICMLMPIFSMYCWLFLAPLLYFPFILFTSVYLAFKKKEHCLVLDVMLVFIIQHFGYAAGELFGIVNSRVK